MPDSTPPRMTTVSAAALDHAVAMLCCRFGEPELEADRRGRIRALVHSSRALALALETFVRNALPHARGEHACADMRHEARTMAQAFADFTFSVDAAATTYRECRGVPSPDAVPRTDRVASTGNLTP